MYLAYKIKIKKAVYFSYIQFLILGVCLITGGEITAQNTTSPYSVLGIGDVETKDYGRYFSEGSAGISRRDENSYNFSNPASLTALPFKTMHFDIALRGRISDYKSAGDATASVYNKDVAISRVTLAFRQSETSAIAVGFRPYSTVNYKYSTYNYISDGNSTYSKIVDGDGGINQVYFSYAKKIKAGLNAGVTASWLFGSLKSETLYYNGSADLDVSKKETDFKYGASLQAGLQYETAAEKKWKHTIGLTATLTSNLNGQLTSAYADASGTFKSTVSTDSKFKMPLNYGVGYTATFKKTFLFSLEGNYYDWSVQKLNYQNSYTSDGYRLSAGFEYSPKKKIGNYLLEKYYFGAGISYEKYYQLINGNELDGLSYTLGAGYNVSRLIFLHGGLEFGTKGNIGKNQIKENYTQILVGFTLRDIWIGSKKFGRFH